jgi:hypothetical protein
MIVPTSMQNYLYYGLQKITKAGKIEDLKIRITHINTFIIFV